MNELSLFTGAGGGLLASQLLGWKTIGAVEIDQYCQAILRQRQEEGYLDGFPIYGDIRGFDGRYFRGRAHVVTGGFPCQDISSAGQGRGLAGERSGLWFEMLRVIDEVRPRFVFAENSPYLRTRGLGTVLQGLARLGYDARWGVLGAWHLGAPHKRNRLWVLAYSDDAGERVQPVDAEVASPPSFSGGRWWDEARFAGVDDGDAHRMDRVRATGNAQVPVVAAAAFRLLSCQI